MSVKTLEILEQIKSLTLDETAQLVKQIETTFNVDTSIPVLIPIEKRSQLAVLGAEQFFVVNSTDLAALPLFEQYSEEAAKFRDVINKSLPGQLDTLNKQLGVEVALYDHVAISNKIRSTPATFGFTNINDACKLLYTTGGVEPACSTPDNYYYFDEIHPTRGVHQIIGEDMANFLDIQKTQTVPEPSNVVALIACIGIISLLRRKVHSS